MTQDSTTPDPAADNGPYSGAYSGPAFNNARGAAATLQMAPPFSFSDVTMTVFPLQANLTRLTQFVDGYLNPAPEITRFKPILPYVYLIILDYGKMSTQAATTGWVAQREVAFGVPLQWDLPGPQGFGFHDWAFTTPFIFVDNELSLSTGREVYGWPKLLAHLDAGGQRWLEDPHGAQPVFEISTGQGPQGSPFLSVTHTPLAGLSDLPPRLEGWADSLRDLPMLLNTTLRSGRDLWKLVTRPRGAQQAPDPQQSHTQLGGMLRGILPQIYSNTINYKQFRDADQPDYACFQALTAAKMPILRLGGGGMLGAPNMALGQINGGYNILLHRSPALPIVDTLGLIPAENRGDMVRLSPVCPFWVKLDMSYGTGQTLAWRPRHGGWRSGQVAPQSTKATPPRRAPADRPHFRTQQVHAPHRDRAQQIEPSNPFNSMRGASEATGGRFHLKNAQLRVLPLPADPAKLSQFVDSYVQVPDHLKVRLWGAHVYMVVSHLPEIHAERRPGQTHKGNELSFLVPVKVYDTSDPAAPAQKPPVWVKDATDRAAWAEGAARLVSTACLIPFSYVDDIRTAISQNEVIGVPTLRAQITSPQSGWTHNAEGLLAQLRAIVVSRLDATAEGTEQTLINIRQPAHNGPTCDKADATPASEATQQAQLLSQSLLGGSGAISTLSLKQFRDADDPQEACYQGIVLRHTRLETLRRFDPIETPLSVEITRYPTQPIAELLGLIAHKSETGPHGMVDHFTPEGAFEIAGDLERGTCKTLFERNKSEDWNQTHLPDGRLGWQETAPEALADLIGKDRVMLSYRLEAEAQGAELRAPPHPLTQAALRLLRYRLRRHKLITLKVLDRARALPLGETALPVAQLAGALELTCPQEVLKTLEETLRRA